MEVVSHGSTAKKYKCETCGCEFLACDIDFTAVMTKKTGGKWNKMCACPECGKAVEKKDGN